MNFEDALREHLEADPKLRRRGKRILAVLNGRPSKRRTRQIERWERHARVELGLAAEAFPNDVAFDWSTIDWAKWLGIIIQLILALLMFI